MDRVSEIRDAIACKRPVHMSGIGGVGMAGLALHLQSYGLPVSGCDLQEGPFLPGLASAGIRVCKGHFASSSADPVAWVIRSAAVREVQADILNAQERGIPVFTRGEVLAALVRQSDRSVAIAGTHGKTTTATLTAQMLSSLDPSWCIGGVCEHLPMPAGVGKGPFVVEADESDGSLAFYSPDIALITNVDFDHMEHFNSVEAFEACFLSFLQHTRECMICCADDVRAVSLCVQSKRNHSRFLQYGFSSAADVRGSWSKDGVFHVSLPDGGTFACSLPARLPGEHNALNLLGALTVCYALGVPQHVWSAAIPALRMPARRFETLIDQGGVRVVTDYAHHPAEISVLIRMASQMSYKRIVAVFQPHRYSRTVALRDAFPSAFLGVDRLILTPVYAASEDPLPGGTSADLLHAFACIKPSPCPELVADVRQAVAKVLEDVREGDLILIIGAGDIERVGRKIAEAIRGLNGVG